MVFGLESQAFLSNGTLKIWKLFSQKIKVSNCSFSFKTREKVNGAVKIKKKVNKTELVYSQAPNNRSSRITIAKGNFGKTAIIFYPNKNSTLKSSQNLLKMAKKQNSKQQIFSKMTNN